MAREGFEPEGIVVKLRQVGVVQGQGGTVVDAIRRIGGEPGRHRFEGGRTRWPTTGRASTGA